MSKILAKVGELTVTEAEVNEFIATLGQRGAAYNNPEGRKAVLGQLINNKLLLQDARRNLYEGEAAFREQFAKLKEGFLINYAGEKAIASAKVDEAEARAYFDENKDQFMSEESVNASHILVKSEDEAKAVLAEIKEGKISFEDAAKKYSSCPSKDNGGNLGDFGRGQMVPEFDSAVFAMEEGEVTDAPVKTQFGYHLIKLVKKNAASAMEYDKVKDELKNMLLSEKRRKAYESKINQLKIMYPVDIF
ncbi:MAG: peptidylprolyl isomerase [Clostridia bacterium]|nr:peptidylprolyl isomerase [Clostridia bacterium]